MSKRKKPRTWKTWVLERGKASERLVLGPWAGRASLDEVVRQMAHHPPKSFFRVRITEILPKPRKAK